MSKKLILFLVVAMLATVAFADVNVTFRANTSMIRGISDTLGYVDVRGSMNGWTGETDYCTNLGGDYWETTFTFSDSEIGSTVEFKFGAGVVDYLTGDVTSYWENDAPGGEYLDNRSFVIPAQDTVLQMAYVGHPYGTSPFSDDTKYEVLFRVNMESLNGFDPATDSVFIVGAFPGPDGSDNMWNPNKYQMTREDETYYYQYLLSLDETYEATMYRFTLGSWDESENVQDDGVFDGNENRGTPVNQDTTLAWKWWNNVAPTSVSGDTVSVTFKTNLANAIDNNGFSIGDGDSLCVRVGYFNSAQYDEYGMNKVGLGGYTYQVIIDSLIIGGLGDGVYYQYYKVPVDGGETRETYFNFDYEGDNDSEAERRYVEIESNGQVVEDVVDSETEAHRMPVFRNTNAVSQDVTVTYTLDLRPAYVHVSSGIVLEDIQGNFNISSVSDIDNGGVYMNGGATGGWSGWGTTLAETENKKMWDDGTHGDAVAGDTIYTVVFTYGPDSSNSSIGQEFKFGISGGDNESGYGLNHIENIDDSQSSATIHSQWGSINPIFYSLWDYDTQSPQTGIDEIEFAEEFELSQNYPNPFNPTTNIKFSVKTANNVYLTIYNMLGQKVQEMHYTNMNAGSYHYTWNAVDMTGARVGSGIYFYKLQVDDKFTSMKKMILLK